MLPAVLISQQNFKRDIIMEKISQNFLDRSIPHSNISPLNFLGAPVENSFFCLNSL